MVWTHPFLTDVELQNYYDVQELSINGHNGETFIIQYQKDKSVVCEQLGYKQRLDEIFSCAPSAKSVLDVGCGTGLFIDFLQSQGIIAKGLELSRWSHAVATKRFSLSVFQKVLEDDNVLTMIEPVDVITMYDVLEHTRDPLHTLRNAYKILNPGGILVVNAPNIDGFISRVTGKYWNKHIPPNHLFFFNRTNIKNLIKGTGFSIESFTTNNGDKSEFIGELLSVPWQWVGKIVPAVERAYARKDELLSNDQPHKKLTVLIKVSRKLFRKLGLITGLIYPSLDSRGLGEGLHVILRKR